MTVPVHTTTMLSSHQSSVSPATAAFHQYSCVRCRTRKIKCDHLLAGCATCKAAGAQCIYLARRSRKKGPSRSVLPLLPAVSTTQAANGVLDAQISQEGFIVHHESHDTDEGDILLPYEVHDLSFESKFDSSNGRLFVSHGKSRYINSRKADEVANLERVIVAEHSLSPEPNEPCNPQLAQNLSSRLACHDFADLLLSNSPSTKRNLRTCQPSAEVMGHLWKHYVSNVDKVVKVLYKPAAQELVMQAQKDTSFNVSNTTFLFAIWLATVTAMSDGDCLRLTNEHKVVLLDRYRQCLVQALVEAPWMTTQETVILQALVLALACSSWKNTRSTWMLSGIALSIAQAMGMHQDSASFGLNIVDTEIRRRIWWTLCLLDKRISDDCGLDTHLPMTMDTKLPLHVNDADLEAASDTGALVPRDEFTEMTMSMIKLEVTQTNLKIGILQHQQSLLNTAELENLVRQQVSRYEDIYLNYFDQSIQLHRLCYLGIKLIIAKLWKLAYDERRRSDSTSGLEDVEDMFLIYNSQVLEFAHQLPDRSNPYGWSFRCKYSQWHAMAYLLIELCRRTHGPIVERAWHVLDAVFRDLNQIDTPYSGCHASDSTRHHIPVAALRKLYQRACHYRLQSAYGEDSQQAKETHDTGTPGSSRQSHAHFLTEDEEAANILTNYTGAMSNDPFLGSETQDFNIEEFTWDGLDSLMQSFETDTFDFGGYQSITGMEPLSLW